MKFKWTIPNVIATVGTLAGLILTYSPLISGFKYGAVVLSVASAVGVFAKGITHATDTSPYVPQPPAMNTEFNPNTPVQ